MHHFNELISSSTSFTINALNHEKKNLLKSLENNAPTSSIKALQMINLQKAIIATGMFALFDAELQRELNCENGFKEALKLLEQKQDVTLTKRFKHFNLAINVLKHGRGWSLDTLLSERDQLPFVIKNPEDSFFHEGDIDEVATLIKVDDDFLMNCAKVINDVSKVIHY